MRASPTKAGLRSTPKAKSSKIRHGTASSTPLFKMKATLALSCRLCSFPHRCTPTICTRIRHRLHRTLPNSFNLTAQRTTDSALCQLCTTSCGYVLPRQQFNQTTNRPIDQLTKNLINNRTPPATALNLRGSLEIHPSI